jgi:type IV secretory pathway TraG/TraD family ATPase VirD4
MLGKERKNGSVAPVVSAMITNIFDQARVIASEKPGSRLDPPLTVELNEAAHIAPVPDLPAYMGDSGGFSIALHVYLQSLSQARARWGEHEAMVMWDNAAVRVIMGGAGNINDLEEISQLMGEIREPTKTTMRGTAGSSVSVQKQKRRVLSAEEIRTLPFGKAVVVARATRPVELDLTPWWKRRDGAAIAAGKADTEAHIKVYTEAANQRRQELLAAGRQSQLASTDAAADATTVVPLRMPGQATSPAPHPFALPRLANRPKRPRSQPAQQDQASEQRRNGTE